MYIPIQCFIYNTLMIIVCQYNNFFILIIFRILDNKYTYNCLKTKRLTFIANPRLIY